MFHNGQSVYNGPIGFRPAEDIGLLTKQIRDYSGPGKISAEPQDEQWTAKEVIKLTEEQYSQIAAKIDALQKSPPAWSPKQNCVALAIEVGDAAGLRLPAAVGATGVLDAPNPGTFAFNMQNTTPQAGIIWVMKGKLVSGGTSC